MRLTPSCSHSSGSLSFSPGSRRVLTMLSISTRRTKFLADSCSLRSEMVIMEMLLLSVCGLLRAYLKTKKMASIPQSQTPRLFYAKLGCSCKNRLDFRLFSCTQGAQPVHSIAQTASACPVFCRKCSKKQSIQGAIFAAGADHGLFKAGTGRSARPWQDHSRPQQPPDHGWWCSAARIRCRKDFRFCLDFTPVFCFNTSDKRE